nr:uncharacterized protein LOC127315565 [Lolium perenne]
MSSLSNGSNPFASDASDDFSFPNPTTLREYNLRDHIDGSVDLFARRDNDWLAIDATIIRWLFLTISPDIFKTVVREGDDAHTVWTKINELFTGNKLQRIVFLQQEFFCTPQNDQTLDAYCLRLKAISDELHDLGFKIGDEILLSTLTAGLNEELGNAAADLTLMTKPTFERAVTYLKLEERRLKNLRTRAVHTALAAGYRAPAPPAPAPPQQAPHPWTASPLLPMPPQQLQQQQGRKNHRRRGGGRNNGGGNGGGNDGGNGGGNTQPWPPWSGGYNPWTGIIHAYSMPALFAATPPYAPAYHTAPPPYTPPQPAWDPALFAALQQAPTPGSYAGGGDWFMDTGASSHMTAHPGNLSHYFPTSTESRIIVGRPHQDGPPPM